MRNNRPILLVEDDKIDALTVKRALKENQIQNELHIAQNGEEALKLLNDPHRKKPCLILLDLNMPRMNGVEFLKAAKSDEDLSIIPVIILTTSQEQQDRLNSFRLGAAGYMLKSVDYAKFINTVKTIDEYWTLSELPFKE